MSAAAIHFSLSWPASEAQQYFLLHEITRLTDLRKTVQSQFIFLADSLEPIIVTGARPVSAQVAAPYVLEALPASEQTVLSIEVSLTGYCDGLTAGEY